MAGNKSATFLVIFIVAIVAFCLACVCASMTGQISILPNGTESGGILDNLSAITNDTGNSGQSYGSQDYTSSSSSSSYHDDSQVETTTDYSEDSGSSGSDSSSGSGQSKQGSGDSSSSSSSSGSSGSDSGHAGQGSGDAADFE